MNWTKGLKRISLAFWGLFMLFGAMAAAGGIVRQDYDILGGGIFGMAIAYGLHRVTCWIIDGFTSK